ncbi:MAG TPA: hypothetical protein VFV15_04570 [Moraxellaceae bacterium]|nr:hypothetical protein [Moraxellaceae bacterium]
MNKKVVAAGVLAGVLALAGGALWWLDGEVRGALPGGGSDGPGAALEVPEVDAQGLSGFDEREKAIIQQLRKKYGAHIASVAEQVKVLANLRDLLRQLYPQDWERRLLRILGAAFPEQAREMLGWYQRLLAYEAWLKDVLPALNPGSPEATRQALWDKRTELFGEAAYEIWAVEMREQKLQEKLTELATSTAPFRDKADTYIEALRATYGDRITGPEAPHLTQNMTRFLELESVQRDLRGVGLEERRQRLREFRQAMGLDEAALKRWDALDVERDSARVTGQAYLDERARLEARYQGAELQARLETLQERLFGAEEATFIRNEEASGYYRFKTPQTLGVN